MRILVSQLFFPFPWISDNAGIQNYQKLKIEIFCDKHPPLVYKNIFETIIYENKYKMGAYCASVYEFTFRINQVIN